jgi:ribosomal protein S18 acetylase RimI-like enzyme
MTPTNDSPTPERLQILEQPARCDVQFLDDRIDEENMARTAIRDARLLAIFRRDDQNVIVAGLYGWTWGRCCEVKTLWVHERWRKRGLGTRLMAAAEDEARRRGATQMVLSTHSFQAPALYRRLGFELVGRIEEYPVGHQSLLFRKRLHGVGATFATRGAR